MPGRMVEHVAGAVWAAMRIPAAAHRPDFGDERKKRSRLFGLREDRAEECKRASSAPPLPLRVVSASPSPEILLHRDAVRDAADRAERQCAKARQSTDMITDERQTALVKIPTRFNVGGHLFAGGVVAKFSTFSQIASQGASRSPR